MYSEIIQMKYKLIGIMNDDPSVIHDRINIINQAIAFSGIRLELTDIDEESILLGINYPDDKNTRNAGRKRKAIFPGREVTVREVRQMIKEKGPAQTAEFLGIGQATLYRRLREYGDHEDWIL